VLEQNERFRQAQLATKHMAPGQQKAAYELAQHSQLLPRDLQVQSLYGRGLTVYCTNGLRFYSVASRNDMSIVLDALGVEPGSMLYRGTDWWMAIPPGLPGYVLTAPDDLNDPPLWLPGGGGGAASEWLIPPSRDPDTSAPTNGGNAVGLTPFTMQADYTLTEIEFECRATSATAMYACIYDADATGGTLTGSTLVGSGGPTTIVPGTSQRVVLDSPVSLEAGKSYWAGLWWGSWTMALCLSQPRPFRYFGMSALPFPSTAPSSSSGGLSSQMWTVGH